MLRHALRSTDLPGMLLLLAAGFVAMPAGAQVPIPSAAQVPAPSVSPLPAVPTTLDSAIVVVEVRDNTTIEHDTQQAIGAKTYIEQRIEQAKELQARVETAIKVQESEIKAIEAQFDLAKARKTILESQIKLQRGG